jgi:hypothetical protein
MQILDGLEEASDLAKLRVGADLFKVSLGQAQAVVSVGLIRSIKNLTGPLPHSLITQFRLPVAADP